MRTQPETTLANRLADFNKILFLRKFAAANPFSPWTSAKVEKTDV